MILQNPELYIRHYISHLFSYQIRKYNAVARLQIHAPGFSVSNSTNFKFTVPTSETRTITKILPDLPHIITPVLLLIHVQKLTLINSRRVKTVHLNLPKRRV